MEVLVCFFCHFPLVDFHIFSLSLIFANLITMCLAVLFFGFNLPGTLFTSQTWLRGFLSHVWEVFSYSLLKYLLDPFSISYHFWTPIMQMMVCLICPRGLLGCLYFILCFVQWQWFPPFCLLGHLFLLLPHLFCLIPSSIYLISVSVLFVSVCCSLVLPGLY